MDKPTPDFTIDDMMTELGVVKAYRGPNAYTVADLVKESGRGEDLCRENAEENVKNGLWVKVSIAREDRANRVQYLPAYVNKEVYKRYMEDSLGAGSIGISQENLG